jgi:nitroreductase
MLSVAEAIAQRRSVRKFKPDPVPDEIIDQMLEAARGAPSASNRQPWRFQVIRDAALKQTLFDEATFGSQHILQAPVIIVAGSELLTFVKGHKMAPPGSEYFGAESEDWDELKKFIGEGHQNTFIAVEHMALMATALGVGTCWVQRIKYGSVGRVLGWPRHVAVCTLLLVGYADDEAPPRSRLAMDEIVIEAAG